MPLGVYMSKQKSFDVLNPHLDLGRNYFIEASAGSGKTFCLEMFILRLFLEKKMDLQRILVVTFTIRAKEELSQRIFDRIHSLYEMKDLDLPPCFALLDKKEMRSRLSEAIRLESAPSIDTIHGFCMKRAKNLGIVPEILSPSETFADFTKFLTYHELEITPTQLLLAIRYSQNSLDQLYLKMKRSSESCEITSGSLLEVLKQALEEFATSISPQTLLDDLLSMTLNYSGLANKKGELKASIKKKLKEFCALFSKSIDESGIDFILLHGNIPLQFFSKPKVHQKEVRPSDSKILEKLNTLSKVVDPLRSEKKLLQSLQNDYRNYLGQKKMFQSLDDVIALFSAHLSTHATEQIQSEFDTVLIDEFQDTDQTQWEIFSKLFFSNKQMIVVGDPKQSIYGFRKADLYAYEKAKKMFAKDVVSLHMNFRSCRQLTEPLNQFFSLRRGILWLAKNNQLEPFIPQEAVREKLESEVVCLLSCEKKTKTENEQILFSKVLSLINKQLQKDVRLEEVACIVKDRHQGARLNSFLKQSGLPTQFSYDLMMKDIELFFEINLLVHCLLKGDIFGFKTFLTKSLFGITLTQLDAFSQNGLASNYIQLRDTFFHSGLLATIYRLKNMPYFHFDDILFPDAIVIGETIEKKLLEQNLTIFQIHLVFKQCETMFINKKEGEYGVEIITNHRAKGLEFDVVFFLAGYGGMPKVKDENKEKNFLDKQAEKLRNLYVGLTRAKNSLYIAYIPSKSLQVGTSSLLDFYFAFTHAEELSVACLQKQLKKIDSPSVINWFKQIDGFTIQELTNKEVVVSKIAPSSQEVLLQAPFSYQKNNIPLTSFSLETSGLIVEHKKIDGNEPAGKHIGQIFHDAMEIIFSSNLYQHITEEKIRALLQKIMPKSLFDDWFSLFNNWIDLALHFEYATTSGPVYLSDIPEKNIFAEVEFLYYEKDKLVKGFIDLIFIHENQIYLLDWKTNILQEYGSHQMSLEMDQHQYYLQAFIYKKAIQKIKLFESYSFGGAMYVFVRGLSLAENQNGTVIFDPSEVFI